MLDGVSPKAIAPFSNQIDTQIVIIRDDQNPPQGELTFALENIFPKHWVSIADESPGKVLKLAHFFSKALMELNSNYTCFFTKNFTIISALPELMNRQFAYDMDHFGMKQFWSNESMEEQLTECFMRKDSAKILLLEDGLINPAQYEHMDWQLELIQMMHKSEIRVENIWSEDLFWNGLDDIFNGVIPAKEKQHEMVSI